MNPTTTPETPVKVIDYAASFGPAPGRMRRWIQALLALAATLVYPGLGHMLARKWRRGAAFVMAGILVDGITVLCMTTPWLLPAGPILFVAVVGFSLVAIVDGTRCGWRTERPLLRHPGLGVIATMIMLVLAFMGGVRWPVPAYLKAYEVEAFVLGGQSMVPALQPGDRLLSDKDEPWGRWDIVTYVPPGKWGMCYVGRVVGLPGETIEIIDGAIHIDGQVVPIPASLGPYTCGQYPYSPDRAMLGRPGAGCEGNPITLADDEVFVLGDNSAASLDSRYWTDAVEGHQLGALPKSSVVGRVTLIYYPLSRWQIMN